MNEAADSLCSTKAHTWATKTENGFLYTPQIISLCVILSQKGKYHYIMMFQSIILVLVISHNQQKPSWICTTMLDKNIHRYNKVG
jgi:hypothetical protein